MIYPKCRHFCCYETVLAGLLRDVEDNIMRGMGAWENSNSFFLICYSQFFNLLFRQFCYQYNFIDRLSHFQQNTGNFQLTFQLTF